MRIDTLKWRDLARLGGTFLSLFYSGPYSGTTFLCYRRKFRRDHLMSTMSGDYKLIPVLTYQVLTSAY